MDYNFHEIEKKWQRKWSFAVSKPDYYVLSMWPYPSGKLHMGHLRNYLLGDIIARFKTMQGFKVLHPMGWDAFGLPAENAAIERGVLPKEWTLSNIASMREELKKIGFSFDWSQEETSCLPSYYKHEQKMFLEFLQNGIAYKKESIVNWDPIDNTVLANEQVIDGKGWRSGALVEKRLLSQWFLKVSDFSAELLEGLKELDKWPEKVRTMQENWIGRSEGCEIDFEIENFEDFKYRFGTNSLGVQNAYFTTAAKNIRQNQTEAKKKLWEAVRGSNLGFKMRRDYPTQIGFIIDFISLENKIVVEIAETIDIEKQKYLENNGFKVFYFSDNQILQDLPNCISLIKKSLLNSNQNPHPAPLPEGEGERKSLLQKIKIFTTKPETLFGASFVAISYAHPLVSKIMEIGVLPLPLGEGRGEGFDPPSSNLFTLKEFVKECEKGSTKAEDIDTAEKKGFFTGLYAINPVNGERLPVYIANFVLMDYGTGAIFGCPAHDMRDFDFAVKYNLPIKQVVSSHKGAVLESENFYLKPFAENDFENLLNLYKELNENEMWVDDSWKQKVAEKTIEGLAKERVELYKKWQEEDGFARWAIFAKDTNEFVGQAGFCHFFPKKTNQFFNDKDVEIGYAFLNKFQGKKYSSEIVNALLNWAFSVKDISRIVAVTNPHNNISKKVLEKAGFQFLGEAEDESCFAIEQNLGISALKKPILGDGFLINSEDLNGLSVKEAREKMFKEFGKKVNYRLKDWGVSRQRYWGCPIPVINCTECGIVPVPESELPVTLPEDVIIEAGENPLKKHPAWRFTTCPNCKKPAERETDTLDTFFESSWYFLRFSSANMEATAFENPLKVNDYVGGIEHAILHLLYARFFTRALKKCGYPISFEEPFERLITQGMVCHKTFQDLNGKWLTPEEAATTPPNLYTVGASIKMSKSKKNVIEPATIVDTFGADTARLFMASDNPPERDMEWSDEGVISAHRFLNKLWNFAVSLKDAKAEEPEISSLKTLHKILASYTQEIEAIAFNKSVAKIRELSNLIFASSPSHAKFLMEYLLALLSPISPHISFEIAEILGFDITKFPEIKSEFLIDSTCTISVQINGKLRGTIEIEKGSSKEKVREKIMEISQITKHLEEKTIKKEIFVQDKIFSFVI